MKLKAQTIPYSSIVGGGVLLLNPVGKVGLQLAIIGGSTRVTKEITETVSARLADLINEHGLEISQ